MSGEGFTFSALSSLKNNRGQRNHINPFRKRVKKLRVHHIEGHETKHLSKEEMNKLRIRLRKEKNNEQKNLIFTFLIMTIVLAMLIVLITGLAIF